MFLEFGETAAAESQRGPAPLSPQRVRITRELDVGSLLFPGVDSANAGNHVSRHTAPIVLSPSTALLKFH